MKTKGLLTNLLIMLLLFTGCEKKIVSPETNTPTDEYFTFTLNSNPQGALIYLDGKYSGFKTPCTIPWVVRKFYSVTYKLTLFMDGNVSVDGTNSSEMNSFYDYYSDSRNFGVISCTTKPTGANVYLDGLPLNKKTPYSIPNLRPGRYWVKFKYPEFRADSIEATVQAQNVTQIERNLVDTTKFVDYSRETNSYYSSCVMVDKYNRVWFGSAYNGVFVYSNKTFTNYNRYNSPLPSNLINYLFQDSDENVWICSSAGIAKLSKEGSWEIFTKENTPLPVNTTSSMCEDNNKNVWIATNKGLVKYKDGIWEILNTGNSQLLGNDISAVGCSSDNSLWVVCYGYGVSRYSGNNWEHFTASNSVIANKYLLWLYCGADNSVLVASTDVLYKRINETWQTVNIPTRNIISIFSDSDKNIWISNVGGFNIIKSSGTTESISWEGGSYMSGTNIKSIIQDKNKTIWFATYKYGLVKYKYYK